MSFTLEELTTEGVVLEQVNAQLLSFDDALTALQEDEWLVIKGYESSRHKDVLVRVFRDGKYPVTQVSYQVQPVLGEFDSRFWQIYDVPLNALALFPVYLYDETVASYDNLFSMDNVVSYSYVKDVSIVTGASLIEAIYSGSNGEYYYKLVDEIEYYHEAELTLV